MDLLRWAANGLNIKLGRYNEAKLMSVSELWASGELWSSNAVRDRSAALARAMRPFGTAKLVNRGLHQIEFYLHPIFTTKV